MFRVITADPDEPIDIEVPMPPQGDGKRVRQLPKKVCLASNGSVRTVTERICQQSSGIEAV